MLERHERDGGAALLRDVDAAVTDRLQLGSSPLRFVGLIEIVAAGDERLLWERRYRQLIASIVGGSLWSPRNLVVNAQMPGAIVMSGALLGECFAAKAHVWNRHTHTAIGQGAGRAGGRVLLI